MPNPKKTKQYLVPLNVRIELPVRLALGKAAEADARTLSSLVQKLLTEHVREGGYLK
jgi:hypothetical protein